MTVVSRQLLVQGANLGLEKLIKLEMLRSIGSAIDGYALGGSGTRGQPLGLLNQPRNTMGQRDLCKLQPAVAFGGAATWAELVTFPGIIEQTDITNADGSFGWIVGPLTKQKWSASQKVSGFPSYLCEDNKAVGYPLRASNNLAATNQCVFAKWSNVILGLWPLSVRTDPYTLGTSSNVRIFCDIFCDVGVLVGPSVCISADAANQ
jgi:hypothetical protein